MSLGRKTTSGASSSLEDVISKSLFPTSWRTKTIKGKFCTFNFRVKFIFGLLLGYVIFGCVENRYAKIEKVHKKTLSQDLGVSMIDWRNSVKVHLVGHLGSNRQRRI